MSTEEMQIENVHLLLVEDNPRYLNELREWLEDFGYRQIVSATSASEAQEKLRDFFDVIIADMRMENDDSGFAVMDEVKARNLSSVVIILTANDTVKDCRTAFKKGAWDYISKSMRGNVFEVLDESIREAITYFNRWGNIQDRRLISELVKLPESSRLEFKSTYQWDVRQNCKNKDLKFSVLKTIAAFLNSEGGTLIIGVENDGNILGLEKDFSLMSKGNPDRFERDVMQLIKENIGAKFTQFVTVRFERVEGKDICAVEVRKSAPAFMKGKNGIEFYIRSGNASEPLDVKNLNDYL